MKNILHIVTQKYRQVLSQVVIALRKPKVIPFTTEQASEKGKGFVYKGKEYIHHSDLHPKDTAFKRVSDSQFLIIFTLIVVWISALVINWHETIIIFIGLLTFLYFTDLIFNFFLICRSFVKPAEIHVSTEDISAIDEKNWPAYTVFCPLYKEWQVLPQFIQAMSQLDYPKNKLEVMLLLEEDDAETIQHVKMYDLPRYFSVVIVPDSFPKTKPKACNYGLSRAKGEYVVIYDAEDVPEPQQLKKSVIAFQNAGDRVVCIQAKLNFYNPHQNLLTRAFTAEYSLWFDLVLSGLQTIHAVIPLGGTSNHFRRYDLQLLKGWDSFNVTEDCDLGIRIAKAGRQTALLDSVTLEEANSDLMNWLWQRSRWIKGYMQTYLVHMRSPQELMKDWHNPHIITFQLVVGGKVVSLFINPLMWILTFLYFAFRAHVGVFIESFFPTPILYMGLISLLLGNFLYAYYYMIGCAKHEHYELVKYVFLIPIYWLAMSAASWVALYKLLTAPHHWSKTKHGLHLKPIDDHNSEQPTKSTKLPIYAYIAEKYQKI